jgi:lipoyl(octanoyl) transferase
VTAHRLIVDLPLPGPWNMAVDETLLIDATENDVATLRLYRWSEPTLSLGYFQNYDDRRLHPASANCSVVRRQTGGGAILHDREITYSLVLPPSHAFSHRSEVLYRIAHDAFIGVLTDQQSGEFGAIELQRNEVSNSAPTVEPFLCFQRRAIGDVVATPIGANAPQARGHTLPESGDWKVLGSAQRRSRGALLQHGSLLLATSPAAPELPGLADLSAWNFSTEQIEPLVEQLQKALNLQFLAGELPLELESKARDLANKKYGSATWTKRR